MPFSTVRSKVSMEKNIEYSVIKSSLQFVHMDTKKTVSDDPKKQMHHYLGQLKLEKLMLNKKRINIFFLPYVHTLLTWIWKSDCRNSRQGRKGLKWIKFIATTTNELLPILICKLWVKNNYLDGTNIPMSSK